MSVLYLHVSYNSPYSLVREAMSVVREHLGSFRLLEEKTAPPIVDKFGWGTWDAFYKKVMPEHRGKMAFFSFFFQTN